MITQDNAAETCAVHNSCDGTDGDCRTARGTRPVSYDGLDLAEAVALAATTSALPAANDEIGYADVDNEAALHDFEARLRAAGLELFDHGSGYDVQHLV